MRLSLPQSTTGLLLSGGIDSTVLLYELLRGGARVVPFYVRTGCVWEHCELGAVWQIHEAAAAVHEHLGELVRLEMALNDLYGDHWSISGQDVPDDTTADEAVFMPGHNPLLLLKPALWCQMHGVGQLALATLASNPFDDATPEFFAAFESMIHQATGDRLRILRPYEGLTKRTVLERSRHLPLQLTFSCLAPIDGTHCGRCNKCAERRLAFRQIGRSDPTRYAAPAQQHTSSATEPHLARR